MNRVPVIEAENLSIGYRDGSKARQELYDSLTFSLYRGELTCLLGTKGAGKSTLLRFATGIVRDIVFRGKIII